jgi:hypothetical protein
MISSTIVAQKDLDRLVEQGSDRWKVINAFLHLESFNDAIETLNEEKKDLEGTGPTRPGQIRTEGEKLEQLERDLIECRRRQTENQAMNAEMDTLTDEIRNLTTRYQELDSLHIQLTTYEDMASRQQKVIDEAKAKQGQLGNHRAAVSALQSQVAASQGGLSKYAELSTEQDMSRVSKLVEGIRMTDVEISRLEESVRTKSSEVDSAEKELQGYDKAAIEKARATKGSLWPYAGGTIAAFGLAVAFHSLSIQVLPWVAGALGLVLLLHFGTFQIVSLVWQSFGVKAKPIMSAPLRSTSLGEFWGKRWNLGFRQLAHELIFRPMHRILGAEAAGFLAFVVSGLIHDLVISLPAGAGYGLPTIYFVLQGAGITIERSGFGKQLGLGQGVRGWFFMALFVAGPVYWLFHPWFVLRVILPFMQAIHAL